MKTLSTSTKSPSGGFRGLPFGGFRGLLALFLFLRWVFFGGDAVAQTVNISPMGTDYGNKTVKFQVSWTGTTTPANKVWVWIDYCPVSGNTAGPFGPANITAVEAATGGDVDKSSLTGRGFYVTASPTIVTATLAGAPAQWNWCAYASGYAPNAVTNAGGGYTLRGTKPFTINGTLNIHSETFGAGTCITSITDPAGHPGGFADKPAITGVTSPTICYNQTATLSATVSGGITGNMTYTWNINGTQSSTTAASITTQSLTAGITYTVTARNANGCTSAVSNTGTVTVRNNFNAGAIAATGQTICSGAAVNTIGNSTAASGGDNSITYEWRRNGTSIGNNSPTYIPTAYNTQGGTFTRWAHDGTCNTAWAQSTGQWILTVIAIPSTPTLTATTACQGSYITFTASGGSGSYVWSGDISGSGASVNANNNTAGNYTATVYSTSTTNGVTCDSGSTSTTGTITAPASNGQTANACGCGAGTTDCSGTCRTTQNTTSLGSCSTQCNERIVQLVNQCGEVVNSNYDIQTDQACTTGCAPDCTKGGPELMGESCIRVKRNECRNSGGTFTYSWTASVPDVWDCDGMLLPAYVTYWQCCY
jgi:hypothetical protein